MRASSVFKPFAYATAFIADKLNIALRTISVLSFLVAFISVFLFILLSEYYSKIVIFLLIACMLASSFLDEVMRELVKLKKISATEKVWLWLDAYADVLIIFSAIYYLRWEKYALGEVEIFLTFNKILFFGSAIFFGILLNYRKNTSLGNRAERMLLLAVFVSVGYAYNIIPAATVPKFKEYLFLSIFALAALIYLALFTPVFLALLHSLIAGARLIFRSIPIREVSLPSIEAEQPTGRNFTAVVTDGSSSSPVMHAKLTLINKETGKKEVRYTDSSGRSDFLIPEGDYKIIVHAEGFRQEEYERYISLDSGEVFSLSKHSDLSIAVSEGERHTSIAGASVTLSSGGRKHSRRTDNLGIVYFDNLEVATYDITVEAEGYEQWKGQVDIQRENLVSVNLKRAPSDKQIPKISEVIGESALVEYSSSSRVEEAVLKIAQECTNNNRDVFVISTRTESYRKLAKVNLINFEANTENLKAAIDAMPAGSVIIFEALSNLILNLGFAAAYKFISEVAKQFAVEGLLLVCLINKEAHEKEEIAEFEKLFVNLVELKGNKFSLK